MLGLKYVHCLDLELIKNDVAFTVIPTTEFLTRAQLIAETAYLKLCNETEHSFKEEEMPVWCAQYICDNLLNVAKIVLKSCVRIHVQNLPIEVIAAQEGFYKSSYGDTIHSCLCLEVHLKN